MVVVQESSGSSCQSVKYEEAVFCVRFQAFTAVQSRALLVVCRMVQVGNWLLRFQDNKLGPSSRIKQFKKKIGNMWRHQYTCGGISSVLFSGREGKPITMLEHGKEKKKKKRIKVDTRERMERNGNQLQTKTFRYLVFRNVLFFRISAELYS
jgi:hypothetical protein